MIVYHQVANQKIPVRFI